MDARALAVLGATLLVAGAGACPSSSPYSPTKVDGNAAPAADGSGAPEAGDVPFVVQDDGLTFEVTVPAGPGTENTARRFALHLRREDHEVRATVGLIVTTHSERQAPWTKSLPASLDGRALRLGSFSLHFDDYCDKYSAVVGMDVTWLEALFDPVTGRLDGTLAGEAVKVQGDIVSHEPFSSPIGGVVDTRAPRVLWPEVDEPLDLMHEIDLVFDEPVRLPAGTVMATLQTGPDVIGAYSFVPPEPGQALGKLSMTSPGHLPFGAQVELQLSPALTDLAGNPLVEADSRSFTTMPDPGLLSPANAGFEKGTTAGFGLLGFEPISPGPSCLSVQPSIPGIEAKQGEYWALWSSPDNCRGVLTARLSCPANASQLVVSVKAFSSKDWEPMPPYAALAVANHSQRRRVALHLGSPQWHVSSLADTLVQTDWHDVAIDVSDMAGGEVVVSIGNRYDPGCGQSWWSTANKLGLDHIRFE